MSWYFPAFGLVQHSKSQESTAEAKRYMPPRCLLCMLLQLGVYSLTLLNGKGMQLLELGALQVQCRSSREGESRSRTCEPLGRDVYPIESSVFVSISMDPQVLESIIYHHVHPTSQPEEPVKRRKRAGARVSFYSPAAGALTLDEMVWLFFLPRRTTSFLEKLSGFSGIPQGI